jgi:hypothetical protein
MSWLVKIVPLLKGAMGQHKLIALVLVLAVGVYAGFTVAGWKAGSERAELVEEHGRQVLAMTQEHAQEVSRLTRYSAGLEEAIAENNQRIAVAAARAQAAEQARQIAQRRLDELAASSQRRIAILQSSGADNCADVLSDYWRLRQ